MILFLFIILFTASNVFAYDVPPPHSIERTDDAFILAIEYFDPTHDQGIEYQSDERYFIQSALESAIALIPGLEVIHIIYDSHYYGPFKSSSLVSISTSVKPFDTSWLRETAEDLGSGYFQDYYIDK